MFLFFSVARSAHTSQAERANEAKSEDTTSLAISSIEITTETGEKMPTDKLLDISPLALQEFSMKLRAVRAC